MAADVYGEQGMEQVKAACSAKLVAVPVKSESACRTRTPSFEGKRGAEEEAGGWAPSLPSLCVHLQGSVFCAVQSASVLVLKEMAAQGLKVY